MVETARKKRKLEDVDATQDQKVCDVEAAVPVEKSCEINRSACPLHFVPDVIVLKAGQVN